MQLWMGLSALFHLALGAALFTASFALSPGQPSPMSDRVMMVRLTSDTHGEKEAKPKTEDTRKPEGATPTLPSPLEGEGKGGGSLTSESDNEPAPAFHTALSTDISTDDGHGEPSEDPLGPEEDPTGTQHDAAHTALQDIETGHDAYRPLVLAALARAKHYPLLARQRGLEGIVEIAFTIHPDGRVSEPEVISSSRHSVLDQAALGMVQRLGLLPPPPEPAPLRFPARIQYRLDEQ